MSPLHQTVRIVVIGSCLLYGSNASRANEPPARAHLHFHFVPAATPWCLQRSALTNTDDRRTVRAVVQKTQAVFRGTLTTRQAYFVPPRSRQELGCSISTAGVQAQYRIVEARYLEPRPGGPESPLRRPASLPR